MKKIYFAICLTLLLSLTGCQSQSPEANYNNQCDEATGQCGPPNAKVSGEVASQVDEML